jgi:hypothetical protein
VIRYFPGVKTVPLGSEIVTEEKCGNKTFWVTSTTLLNELRRVDGEISPGSLNL